MARPVVLLLPGQGSQHARMAAGLYGQDRVFTESMDEVFAGLGPDGEALRTDWLAAEPVVPIDHVTRSQPLLFAVDYALGRMVLSWGVRPAAMLGHSIGEVAAATLAGVFTLADAVRLVADRIRRLAGAPPGGMLAVAATVADVQPFLAGDVVVGAVNAPRQTVLAGPAGPLQAVANQLRDKGFACRAVPSMSAFHSPVLAPMVAGGEDVFEHIVVRRPVTTVFSGYTSAALDFPELADPAHWISQPVAPVFFWPALDALLARVGTATLVECGPGQGLSTLARRHPSVRSAGSVVLPLLPGRPGPVQLDVESVKAARHTLRQVSQPT